MRPLIFAALLMSCGPQFQEHYTFNAPIGRPCQEPEHAQIWCVVRVSPGVYGPDTCATPCANATFTCVNKDGMTVACSLYDPEAK